MIKKFSVFAVFIIFMSCASNRAVIKPDYDFASVRTVRVGNFSSADNFANSGDMVQSAFIRQLLARGFMVVTDPNSNADVVIEGSVTTFSPDRRYLVRMPPDDGRRGHWRGGHRDMVEVGGSNVYDLGPAFGFNDGSRVIASNATVGVFAFMTDIRTGKVVWSISQTNEGLDLSSALDGVVRFMVRTIPRENVTAR
ncbi:MAG: hypothetical protein FWD54_00255 [Endomicrobia bacterium]|nr:hypothetical protein [Endomicrobiia bacterium]